MECLKEQGYKQLRELEAKSGLYLVTRQQFRSVSRQQHHVGKEDYDPVPARLQQQQRNSTTLQTPNGPAESKFPGAHPRANSQLLSTDIWEYHSEELDLYLVCLKHDTRTGAYHVLDHRSSLSGFHQLTFRS